MLAYLLLLLVFQINHQIPKDPLLFSLLFIINFGKNPQNQMDHLFSIRQVKVIILKSVKAHQANQINQMKLQLVALLHHSCIKAHQINFSLLLVYCFRQLVFLKASNHLLKVNLLKFTARSPHHLFLMLIFPLILEKNLLFS